MTSHNTLITYSIVILLFRINKIMVIFRQGKNTMQIEILEFADGAIKARGLTIIIDVFRAFSVACYAYDAGALKVIATGDVQKALELKKIYRNAILAGERDEKKIPGFDLGNSPTEIIGIDLTGKILVHTTTAGTYGLTSATTSDVILTGSLVNAGAVARYIKAINPGKISLVAMGYRARVSAEEDLLCAEIIKADLEDRNLDIEKPVSDLINTSGKRFFLPENISFSPPTDFFLCTMLNRFNFVLKAVRRSDGNVELERIET